MQRKNTHWFIWADPLDLALIPVSEITLPSGGVQTVAGPPRSVQTLRLIPASVTERPLHSDVGTQGSTSGAQRRHAFTLLGEWDALMAVGDWWEDERGERWEIDALIPHNGYETRGLITAFGRR